MPEYIDVSVYRHIITGPAQSGRTNLLKLLLAGINAVTAIYLLDSSECELFSYQEQSNVTYVSSDKESILQFAENMNRLIKERQEGYEAAKALDEKLIPKAYFQELPHVIVLVEEWEELALYFEDYEMEKAQNVFLMMEQYGITLIITTSNGKLRGYDEATQYIKEATSGVILGKAENQTAFNVPYMRNEVDEIGLGYIVKKGKLKKIKIAKV